MKRVHLGLLATSVMISACGGGGGNFGGQEAVSNSFPITSSNGIQTTRLSYEAALASGGFANVGDLPIAGAPNDGVAIAVVAASAEDVLRDSISLIPFGPVTEPCLGDTGSVTYSGDIASLETLTPGDTFLVEYELCDDGAGTVVDGIIDMTVTDFSGDLALGLYRLAIDSIVTSLEVLTLSDSVTGDGDASIAIDSSQAPFVSTNTAGSQMLQTSNAASQTLSNYRSDTTLDGNQQPEEFTMDAAGTLEHSDLPGSVTYSTPTMFRGLVPGYPSEGVFLVRGDNSTARLTVLDDSNVRVDIDNNGDGEFEYSEDLTWDAFLGNNT